MNRLLRILPLFLLASSLLAGPRIRQYSVALTAQADGTGQATAVLDLDACVPGTLVVPVGFDDLAGLTRGAGPAGLTLEGGRRSVRLTLPQGVPAQCEVRFAFPVPQVFQAAATGTQGPKGLPAGNRLFRHALVNTQEAVIDAYRFEFRLPEGWMVQAIREQLPKLGKAEADPRVRLDKAGARQGAVLQLGAMAQGDDTALLLEATPVRRSMLWLVVGLCLGGLYLYSFRDLVTTRSA